MAKMLRTTTDIDGNASLRCGCRSFRDFLNRLPHRVATIGRSGADITIRFISAMP
jgi:hypothetical protein